MAVKINYTFFSRFFLMIPNDLFCAGDSVEKETQTLQE